MEKEEKKPTRTTVKAAMRNKIQDLLDGNMMLFVSKWLKCDPKSFCNIYLQLMRYVLPQLSNVTLQDDGRSKNSAVEMLIKLRDGDRSAIAALLALEDKKPEEESDGQLADG